MPVAPVGLAYRIAWSIERAASLVPSSTCLVRAMAGQRLLELKGFGSEIRIGLRRGEQVGFEAHAWLCSGSTVIDRPRADPQRFQAFIGSDR